MGKKALIAMSGGVDSSVAAYLMVKAGYDCVGVTMKLYESEEIVPDAHTCCSLDDVEDARYVCETLGIPHHVFNFSDRFREAVIDRFVWQYEHGLTPNPCIDCNRHLKFDKLFERAQTLGFDVVVTGHYARVEKDGATGRYLLKKGLDETKDQSYVLYDLSQEKLARVLFPLGGLTKAEVRRIAEEQGFLNARKHDSQDICFVPDGDYAAFIERHTGKTFPEGDFVDTDGRVLGRHKGIIRYTPGQRKGLGISWNDEPYFVLRVEAQTNTVVLGHERDLYTTTLAAAEPTFIAVPSLPVPMRVRAKVRYRQTAEDATAVQSPDGRLLVTFDKPQRAVTRGQSVVLYDGDAVVAGGVITVV